jgi:Na+/H+-dicarboxylate symporter
MKNWRKSMKKIPLVAKILIGFVSGTAIGLGLSAFCEAETVKKIIPYISPFGSILVAMLKAVVYPIILFSLIAGAACLPLKRSGKVGGIVMAWYFVTSLFATLFGVALAYMLNPSISGAANVASANMASAKEIAGSAVSGTITALITGLFQNPFAALSSGQFLPVIVFAIAFGLASRSILDSLPEESEVARGVRLFVKAVEGAQHISFRLIDWVVCYFPIGVFALSLTNFAVNGTLLFGPYLRITCCVIVGVFAMMFLIYPLAILVFCRQNPYKILLRIKDAMLTAFVTRSSAATLPVSFRAMDGLGVDRAISGFSLPMGSTVNMDGVCVHLPVFVILAANMFGHDLSMLQIATLCISIMFASIGAGGVPGGSVFLLFMVLENMGLPADQVSLVVALALGINPILDMFETCCNVAGDNVCTYIVARKNGLIKDPE